MNLPDWWESVILFVGAWRVFRLLAYDDVLDRPRNYFVGIRDSRGGNEKFMDFLECPYCFGFWIVLATWGAWQLWPHGTLVAMTPFMLSAGVIAVQHFMSEEA